MFGKKSEQTQTFKYPGLRDAMDGNTAVIMCEREASDAAGAYPITPSTQMGEYWAEETAKGHVNVSGRALIFVEPESEHAAAAVTAGMSMSGLRATNFSSAQGVAFMHESLYAAVGKRLPYVLNMGCRAITKASLNVHCGHDDYHCMDDTGFFQIMAKNAQGAADLSLIAHKLAELSLTPGTAAQDGFLTTHLIEPLNVPERALIHEFLGRPDDIIDCPTPAQRIVYGPKRRRVPELWSVDNPMVVGPVQNQDAYMQAVAGQRPYFFEHIRDLAEQVLEEFYSLTGRRYQRVAGYKVEDAEYVILGMGSVIVQAEAVADYLRQTRKLKVGIVDLTMYRPFPGDLIGKMLKGKKGVAVLERTDQPLAEDLPVIREVRAALTKCLENGAVAKGESLPYPLYDSYKNGDMPRLYSGCYGLGSRDLQPEGIIGAIENMLPNGKRRAFFYLSVDFTREPTNPKQEIAQQTLVDAYPRIKELSIRGSENPDLMPEGTITVRIHSVGGWGAVTTGKNLALTLFELLGLEIKANPKYGSEKKGQPTTYYLAAASKPIPLNCEFHFVDVVLCPDPNVFRHSNPLHGLKAGGIFIIQSDLTDSQEVWSRIPRQHQQFILDRKIRVFYLDGFKIAREEATDAELQYRMQGNAFQGAFFAVSPVRQRAGLDEHGMMEAIENQLRHKFGKKGERVVQDNIRVVRRGIEELHEIIEPQLSTNVVGKRDIGLPIMLKRQPISNSGLSDLHLFWEQTGSQYAIGKGNDNLVDPQIALSIMPAATGLYRDMTQIRFEYPKYLPENCTACGSCYTVCPDSAIPGLVSTIADVFTTAINRIETAGTPTQYLRRETRGVEKRWRTLIDAAGETANTTELLAQAIHEHSTESKFKPEQKEQVDQELIKLAEAIGGLQFSITKPYWSNREQKQKGSGGLFAITLNPYACKGCMECVEVCADKALVATTQTPEAVAQMQTRWHAWLDLPTTPPEFIRIDDLNEKIGALDTLLLDKATYQSMVCGDGACMGCGEKTIIHLFTSTVTALMQPRVKAQVQRLTDLITQLETHIRLKLTQGVDISNTAAVVKAIDQHRNTDMSLADLSISLEENSKADPVDAHWLRWVTQLLERLKLLKWQYTEGQTRHGRAAMGIANSTGCTSVWGSTYPYNPYPFPWTNHLFQDSPSLALGLFEGHSARMAEGFKAIRMAEMELNGGYQHAEQDTFFARFNWRNFSEDEWHLCPPVVAMGGDGAMYDIGFQNLSRALMTGTPIKILVLDTQVYSNTGGQACTSSFVSQVADMSPYGAAWKGKREIRKEMSLIGMAHRSAYVMQGSIANITHLLEGYIDGLNSRRPALFNVYAVCQPEHGVADNSSARQSKLAVDGRAYPLLKYNPDAGETFEECLDLSGNPALEQDWPTYPLKYKDEKGVEKVMELPMTFADFAMTEGRFRKHFRKAPAETWNDSMLPLNEFLNLPKGEREGKLAYLWGVDAKNRLMRVVVAEELVRSTEERRQFWRQLRGLTGQLNRVDVDAVIAQTQADMAQKLSQSLLALAAGGNLAAAMPVVKGGTGLRQAQAAQQAPAADVGVTAATNWETVWVDSPACTSCDECTQIAPKVFKYNANKQSTVLDPKGASFRDIVKAAEKCTASCIHPGTPWNAAEPDLEKLMKRAAKYQ